MRRRLILGLVLLNALLAAALYAPPAQTQVTPTALVNCCKSDEEGEYCCHSCCWFRYNCDWDADCQTSIE